jgi:hypothetical protein
VNQSLFILKYQGEWRTKTTYTPVSKALGWIVSLAINARLIYRWQADVRSNIIISVGDLVQRYPNLLADWMPQVYARVRDV